MTHRVLPPSAIIVLAAFFTVGSLGAQPPIPGPPNDCAHPYWSSTLRCKDLALTDPSAPPQPNAGERPDGVSDLKQYTRVFIGNPTLRCVDGTRPVLYVAPAVCTNPGGCPQPGGSMSPPGAPIASNDWLISFTGGGACHARDLDGNGVFEDGHACTDLYPGEAKEMSSAFDTPMKNLGGNAFDSGGILSRNPAVNPVFAAYNSVRVEKCSYDRYIGRAEHANVEGSLPGGTFRYTLFNHGQRIAEAALQELMNGLLYLTWGDGNGDGVVDDVSARLPSLRDARQVVFVAHSGAAHGLRHNIDRLAGLVRGGRDVDVRAVFDANFLPSIEGEAAFAVGLNGDAYTDQWTGSSSASGAAFLYDGETFHRDALVATQLNAWNTSLDESCLAAHSAATRWKCRDRQHVLFHHVSIPMFIREDFLDPNAEHIDGGLGHSIPWALLAGCTYPDVEILPQCNARFPASTEHYDRLIGLAGTLLTGIGTRSEIATGADTSVSAGQVPSVHLWMPACKSHEGAYDNDAFNNTSIEENGVEVSMRGALEAFVKNPSFGHIAWRIHGMVGGKTMTSDCP